MGFSRLRSIVTAALLACIVPAGPVFAASCQTGTSIGYPRNLFASGANVLPWGENGFPGGYVIP